MQIEEGVIDQGQRPRWITPSEICMMLIIHSKYYPDSDWLKAHA